MKICPRALNFIQVIDELGNIRMCSWMPDSIIGNMLETGFKEAFQSPKAQMIRRQLASQDYSLCREDNCPYLANNTMKENLIELPDNPTYPDELYLAYEGKCNYNCTCCTSFEHMQQGKERDWSENYTRIEEALKDVLPHVRLLSANGRGELFTSPHIMNVLANWRPLAPAAECKVLLETNGSLFNEKNWQKIANLGQYNLRVAITVMSFEEKAYQYLSGTKLPVSNIISNLNYVKSLREQGVINYLELATVVQERNFREMPEFTRRCLEEFGADVVRLRPIFPGGSQPPEIQWFADVRNPYHPYYSEYKEVMEAPIFKNPRVLLWSGKLDSTRGRFPASQQNQETSYYLLSQLLGYKALYELASCPEINRVIIYGTGNIGNRLYDFMTNMSSLPIERATTTGGKGVRTINEFNGDTKALVILATYRNDYREEMLATCQEIGLKKIIYEEAK